MGQGLRRPKGQITVAGVNLRLISLFPADTEGVERADDQQESDGCDGNAPPGIHLF